MSTYEANRYNFTGANVTGIPTSAITSGTFADARLSSSSVTQHVDLSNLNASNLTSGTVPNARYGTPTFSAANLTDISATPLAPTEGSWTPSFSHGTWANINGKYQKFGRMVFLQAEFENTVATADDGSINITFGGLPFTSHNPSGGGYNNNWFVGTGYLLSAVGSFWRVYVKDDSTVWGVHETTNTRHAYRFTQYYNTNEKGAMRSSSFRSFVLNSTQDWGFLQFYYLAAS